MKILVCGGRAYFDALTVSRYLDALQASMIIQGGARGADYLAKQWAECSGVHCAEIKALWGTRGRSAGHLRNAAMLTLNPDMCVAFPGGAGTASMIRLCKAAGVMTIEVPI